MRNRISKALVALTLSGALVGGGAVIAHAATASPSAKAVPSSSGSAARTAPDHHCPNM
jgi:hypothetical protein